MAESAWGQEELKAYRHLSARTRAGLVLGAYARLALSPKKAREAFGEPVKMAYCALAPLAGLGSLGWAAHEKSQYAQHQGQDPLIGVALESAMAFVFIHGLGVAMGLALGVREGMAEKRAHWSHGAEDAPQRGVFEFLVNIAGAFFLMAMAWSQKNMEAWWLGARGPLALVVESHRRLVRNAAMEGAAFRVAEFREIAGACGYGIEAKAKSPRL
jgi:hypothetical protein